MRTLALTLIATLAILSWTQAGPSYQNGRVLKITREVRSEGGPHSVMPPEQDDDSSRVNPQSQNYREVFYISIQSGDSVYVGTVKAKTSGFDPQLLTSDRNVQFRFDGTTMYIKTSRGQEFASQLVPKFAKPKPVALKG